MRNSSKILKSAIVAANQKLQSLFDRIVPEGTGPSGPSEDETVGHRLDGADGFAGIGGKVPS